LSTLEGHPVRVSDDLVEVSIVIPCLNEAATLGRCIAKAQRCLDESCVEGEIIVADNGSSDGSREIAAALGARVISAPQRGYGSALIAGVAASRGEFVIMGDADDTYDFASLSPFIERLRSGYDLVIGNRFRGGIQAGAMPLLHRYLGNPVLTYIGQRMFGVPCGDIYCGLRGFRKSSIEALDLRSTGMEFAIEMAVKGSLHDLRIAEVPTTLAPDGRDRRPHLRTWRDGWRSLRFLLIYSPAWLFLYPGIGLMVLGVATLLWLLPGPRNLGGATLDAHTLLYAGLAIIIGFQSVIFAVCGKFFAVMEGLLPEDPQLVKIAQKVRLEIGLAVGAILVLAGLFASLAAVGTWQSRSFGELDYSRTLRIIIPATTLITVGFQTLLSSFFLSMLALKRR